MLKVLQVVLSSLLLTSITCRQIEKCEHTQTSSSGIISSPGSEFTQEYCKWTIVPPETSLKFHVRVLSATLPTNVNLIVYRDNDTNVINEDCENCIDPFVTSTLKIVLQRSDNSSFHFSPKFNISYEAFTPNQCLPPSPLKNGQIIGDKFEVGKSILFDCPAPYHRVGEPMAKCIQTSSSPIPRWDVKVPVCTVPKCSSTPIKLVATARWSALSNPGYQTHQIESEQKCMWNITTTRKDQQLRARFHSIDLTGKHVLNETLKILIYDGSFGSLISSVDSFGQNLSDITTKSNRMIVVFQTGAQVPLGASGFIMNYSSVSIQCPDLNSPVNGKMFPKRKSHGLNDVIRVACNDGYSLVNGSRKLFCTTSGEWSGLFGDCVADKLEDNAVVIENVSEAYDNDNGNASVVYNSSQIRDYDPFSIRTESSTQSYEPTSTIVTYSAKPTKFRKKAYYHTKAVKKSSKKPTMLYNFTRNTPKTKSSKYLEKPTKQVVKVQELNKVRVKTTSNPFDAKTSSLSTSSSTENLEAVESTEHKTMNNFIDTELVVIVAGISVPILLVIIIVLIFIIYRRYYPVRMGIGRKFSTFENPMYERRSPRRDLLPESQYLNEEQH